MIEVTTLQNIISNLTLPMCGGESLRARALGRGERVSKVVHWAGALKYYFDAYMTKLDKDQTFKSKPMDHKCKPLQERHDNKD